MVLGISSFLPNVAIGLFSVLFLVFSSEKVVEKMEGVAKAFGVSESVIAITVVSIGTSLPELVQNLVGSFRIVTEISFSEAQLSSINCAQVSSSAYCDISSYVIGNGIGSDIIQQTAVLGFVVASAAFLKDQKEFRFSRTFLTRDYLPMIGTTLLILSLSLDGMLSRIDGAILLSFFIGYIYYQYRKRDEKLVRQGKGKESERPYLDLFIGLFLMAGVIVSADIFLRVVRLGIGSTSISGSMIGVLIGGMASALPEMATAIQGLRQRAEGISLGTLIGSNIVNPLLAIGAGAYISSYAVPRPLIVFDMPFEAASAGLLLFYIVYRGKIGDIMAKIVGIIGLKSAEEKLRSVESNVLTIWSSLLLILLFIAYIYVRWTLFPSDF